MAWRAHSPGQDIEGIADANHQRRPEPRQVHPQSRQALGDKAPLPGRGVGLRPCFRLGNEDRQDRPGPLGGQRQGGVILDP